MIDDLLDELVPRVEQLPDWNGIIRRARRSRRRRVALGVVVCALVAAPGAVAIVHAFQGTPAPQSISNAFRTGNDMADLANTYAAQTGFAAHEPHSIASTAHGVLQVQTPDGAVDLWAADNDEGGICYLVNWEADGSSPSGTAYAGGSCDGREPPSQLAVGWEWSANHPNYKVLAGRVFVDASTLVVDLDDGTSVTLPVVEHLVLGVVDAKERPISVRALAADGSQLASFDYGASPPR
jgi:hypothetical protein